MPLDPCTDKELICRYDDGNDVLEDLSLGSTLGVYWLDAAWLFVILVLFRLAAYVVLKRRAANVEAGY